MRATFGTDGLRGVANSELTPELALALGRVLAKQLPSDQLLIGRDTRISGPLLCSALSAGAASEGVRVLDVGVIPTPGLAWLAYEHGAPAAMVSASHNPFKDNGIKLFGPGGTKLADEVEEAVEHQLRAVFDHGAFAGDPPVGASVGVVTAAQGAVEGYVEHLISTLEGRRLEGLSVVLDCACGAASAVAPEVFKRLGAAVVVIADQPDGTNINEGCGSTHPESLRRAVVDNGASVGLAFDGDADRVIAVDHAGEVVDGDHLMCLFANDLRERGLLSNDTVVVTVMTNLGFHRAMAETGVGVRQTRVGDRYVLEELEREGLDLGGEQSGHIIFRRLSTTGDGILTGLMLLDLMTRRREPLRALASSAMVKLPQELLNVAVDDPGRLASSGRIWEQVRAVEVELGGSGRVLLRPSGTEPVVRVMVEAATPEQAREVAAKLGEMVAGELAPNT